MSPPFTNSPKQMRHWENSKELWYQMINGGKNYWKFYKIYLQDENFIFTIRLKDKNEYRWKSISYAGWRVSVKTKSIKQAKKLLQVTAPNPISALTSSTSTKWGNNTSAVTYYSMHETICLLFICKLLLSHPKLWARVVWDIFNYFVYK